MTLSELVQRAADAAIISTAALTGEPWTKFHAALQASARAAMEAGQFREIKPLFFRVKP